MITKITIKAEGPQGSGKSTALDHLKKFLEKSGWAVTKLDEKKQELTAVK